MTKCPGIGKIVEHGLELVNTRSVWQLQKLCVYDFRIFIPKDPVFMMSMDTSSHVTFKDNK